jgi:hypothetical protein
MDYSLTNELLEKDTTHTFGNQDWVQFVIDHVRILLSNSDEEIINPNDMFKYRYRPKSLFDKFGINEEDAWIVLLINNIKFSEGIPQYLKKIKIPPQTLIDDMKKNFSAFKSMDS